MSRRLNRSARRLLCVLLLPVLEGCATTEDRVPLLQELNVAPDENVAEFSSAGESFPTPASCREYLIKLSEVFPRPEYGVVRGPYPVRENDVRIHAITAREGDYVIVEYRCLGPAIEARSWSAGAARDDPRPFTLEDIQSMTFPSEAEAD